MNINRTSKRLTYLLLGCTLAATAVNAQSPLLMQAYPLVEESLPPLNQGAVEGAEENEGLLSSVSLYEQAIELSELQDGPFSFELAEQQTSLGDLYQQLGQHEQAILLYEQAQYIIRINNGLFSLDQEPLLEKMIQSYIASGNQLVASQLQEYRYYMYQKNYENNEPEFIQASLEQVNWHLNNYLRNPEDLSSFTSNGASSVPSMMDTIAVFDTTFNRFIFLSRSRIVGFDPGLGCINDSFSVMSTYPTLELELNPDFIQVQGIIENLQEQTETQLDRKTQQALLLAQAQISFLAKEQLEYLTGQVSQNPVSPFNCSSGDYLALRGREYRRGLDALEAYIEITEADSSASVQELAQARLNLADWQMAFGYPDRAEDLYLGAFEFLQASGLEDDEIEALMNPAAPLFIPGFVNQAYSASAWSYSLEQDIPYQGYIDIELVRNTRGQFTEYTVLSSSDNVPDTVVESLLRHLKTVHSRPNLDNGSPAEGEPLRLRYYYTQQVKPA